MEDSAAFIVLLGLLALEFAPFLVELTCEVWICCPPRLIGCLLSVVQEFVLELATGIHPGHKVVYLVVVGDCAPMVVTLYLVPVQLARNFGDIRFWIVAPWRKEMGFDSQLLLSGDDIPRANLGNQCLDGLVFLPYVDLLEFLIILCVESHDNGFDHHRVDHLLESVLLPLDLRVRLDLEELYTLGAVLDSWVDEIWFLEPLAVQIVVTGGRYHLGLSEDERRGPMLPTPFGCHKMACKCCELLDEVSHGVESGLPNNGVERDSFHPSSHNFGDGSQSCRDRRHVCATCAL